MESNQITSLLSTLLFIFLIILFILVIVYVVMLQKNRKSTKNREKREKNIKENTKNTGNSLKSIYDFMEFEDVQDNMIIQKENFKYIMIVECQGVNYDLMSGVEKNGVEEGFLQFLNTLRHPIQIYIQTRTVNLENSINNYRQKVQEIEAELFKRRQEYIAVKDNPNVKKEDKQKLFYKVVKQNNLYEYGRDIIADTERMSLNKNILNKKYYIVIPYYPSDLGDNEYDSYEIRNIAFSELYTRSQAIIRTLSACDVKGKILNTKELIDLLYVAYNRDQEEIFNINKALETQYDKLYSTGEDVYEKKIRILDKEIEDRAIQKAQSKVDEARSELEKRSIEKQNDMEDLINEMAKIVLEANRNYIGEETTNEAISKLEKEMNVSNKNVKRNNQKGESEDAKEEKTKTRRAKA